MVFEWSSWFEVVKLTVEQFHGNGKFSAYTIEVKPNTMKHIGSVDMEISSIYISPLAITSRQFISNEVTTAVLEREIFERNFDAHVLRELMRAK